MKRTGIIILLLLYTFVQLGIFVWNCSKPIIHNICYNYLRLHYISHENEFFIETSLASFNETRQDEHEIFWQGYFYDIENVDVHGNKVTLTVKKDIAETNWIAASENILRKITNNKYPSSQSDIRLCQWLFKLYEPVQGKILSPIIFHATEQKNLSRSRYTTTTSPGSPYQPPDTVS